jgi:hypothetical protein
VEAPKTTPLVYSPTQPPVSDKSFEIYDDEDDDSDNDWELFFDKVAAFGLCAGFVSLGIVIGLNIH